VVPIGVIWPGGGDADDHLGSSRVELLGHEHRERRAYGGHGNGRQVLLAACLAKRVPRLEQRRRAW